MAKLPGGLAALDPEGSPVLRWLRRSVFAVVPGGEVVFAQRNRDASDRPDLDAALEALRRWRERRRAAS